MTTATSRQIDIPFPTEKALRLQVRSGACHLSITPSEATAWVGVDYEDPSGGIPLKVKQNAGEVLLQVGFSAAEVLELLQGVPRLRLTLGKAEPYLLVVDSGASGNDIDLSGLPITRFEVAMGAGRTTLKFDRPNPIPMSLLKLGIGAGRLDAIGLCHAAFEEMEVDAGAAGCRLEFAGTLRHDATVRVSTGFGTADLVIPEEVAAEVTGKWLLGSPSFGGTFTRKGDSYLNAAAQAGRRPLLRIISTMAIGALRVEPG